MRYSINDMIYGFSSLNRYDGVRFNPHKGVADSKVSVVNRTNLLSKTVKERILEGIKNIKAIPPRPRLEDGLYLLIHKEMSKEELREYQFKYALANIVNYCSILIPREGYAVEYIAPAGYQRYLLEYVNQL